jgi:hypothetical protein
MVFFSALMAIYLSRIIALKELTATVAHLTMPQRELMIGLHRKIARKELAATELAELEPAAGQFAAKARNGIFLLYVLVYREPNHFEHFLVYL